MTDLDDLDAYIIHVAELQVIIEQLRAEKRAVLLHVVDLRAEIERLQAELERANNPTWDKP